MANDKTDEARLHVRIERDVHEELKRAAAERGLKASQVVRMLIHDYLEDRGESGGKEEAG